MTESSPAAQVRERLIEAVHANWGWLLALGLAQVLLGFFAISAPFIASVASAVVFGWLLVLSGIVQTFHAFRVRGWGGFLLHLAGGLLYLAAGVLLVARPLAGALTLTLVLAIFFVVEGASRILLALRVRPMQGWGWFLAGGAAGVVLGGLIWAEWPASALWAIGLLLGINLLFSGFSCTTIALAARRDGTAGAT